MATRPRTSFRKLLSQYKVALTNAENNPTIKERMKNYGYGARELEEGWKLYKETQKIYNESLVSYQDARAVNEVLKEKKKTLATFYSLHRKFAKIVFRNDPGILKLLEINKKIPRNFGPWMKAVNQFYSYLDEHPEILEKLSVVNIDKGIIKSATKAYDDVEEAYRIHIMHKGISQNNSDMKLKKFNEMQEWMSPYIAMARLVFVDSPQQLESLGIVVKSSVK